MLIASSQAFSVAENDLSVVLGRDSATAIRFQEGASTFCSSSWYSQVVAGFTRTVGPKSAWCGNRSSPNMDLAGFLRTIERFMRSMMFRPTSPLKLPSSQKTQAYKDKIIACYAAGGRDSSLELSADQAVEFQSLRNRLFSSLADRDQILVSNSGCASCHRLNNNPIDFDNQSYFTANPLATVNPRGSRDVTWDLRWLKDQSLGGLNAVDCKVFEACSSNFERWMW